MRQWGCPGRIRDPSFMTTDSPFGARTLLAGALLWLDFSVFAPYSNMVLQGSLLALDFGTSAAVFLLFLLLLANASLSLFNRRFRFRQPELALIYAMMITACSIPTMGLMEYVLPGLTSLHYYSGPENEWQEQIQPFVKSWMVVEEPSAIKYFYEGLPRDMAIPWQPWEV